MAAVFAPQMDFMKPDHLSDTRFDSLELHSALEDNLATLGFEFCTPIQAQTLPLALAGRDVAGQAQTGTGKTIAFLTATFQRLLNKERRGKPGEPRTLMLAPTRELAIQIHTDAVALARNTDLKVAVVYGGTGYESQRQALIDGVDVLIGTPGRLIDYYKQKVFTLDAIEVVVLDEADRMFDLGFIKDLRYILRRMPPAPERQNYLFSATLSHRVLELAYEHMNDPTKIEIEPEQVTAERVKQTMFHVSNDEKLPLLIGLMRQHDPVRTLVFVNTKRGAEMVEGALKANGLDACTLSGDVPQNKRERLLEQFKAGDIPVMVATDVAARGLHIPAVSHVINFDLPQDAEDYVHRIGRTARAGATGNAISLCCETWVYSLPEIEAYIGHRLESGGRIEDLIPADYIKPPPLPRRERSGGRRGGGRPGGGRPPPRGRRR